jgi:hypothetical protein
VGLDLTLRVVGAGLGRTGTMSLKLALERLLGGPCYHMLEVFPRPDHLAAWHAAAKGTTPDWDTIFEGFVAAVDWPAAAFWPDIAEAFPEAAVLLSTRPAQEWWRSFDKTIAENFRREVPPGAEPFLGMVTDLLHERFTPTPLDESAAVCAYEEHNARVRAAVPAARLIEWQPGDGWEPLCSALQIDVPDEAFPHTNTTAEFRARFGIET